MPNASLSKPKYLAPVVFVVIVLAVVLSPTLLSLLGFTETEPGTDCMTGTSCDVFQSPQEALPEGFENLSEPTPDGREAINGRIPPSTWSVHNLEEHTFTYEFTPNTATSLTTVANHLDRLEGVKNVRTLRNGFIATYGDDVDDYKVLWDEIDAIVSNYG